MPDNKSIEKNWLLLSETKIDLPSDTISDNLRKYVLEKVIFDWVGVCQIIFPLLISTAVTSPIGDVTAVDIKSGKIIWQTPTQSNITFSSTYFLKLSDIVSDGKSIFVSDNNNQFFSIDLLSGTINWKQDLSSELRSALIGDYLLAISDDGLLISKPSSEIASK